MQELVSNFQLPHPIERIEPFGGGHINDTYRMQDEAGGDYLLQRINHHVFPDVAGLMSNFTQVTDHIRQRIAKASAPANEQTTLTIVPARNHMSYYRADDGNYWRILEFLSDLHAYDLVETPRQAYEGARSYGYFLRFLDDFPADRLTEVIPGFHDLDLRLKQFSAALANPVGERQRKCQAAIKDVHTFADPLLVIDRLHKSGRIRRRVTHNDTKFNNVLLTADDRGKCVIDLDTVMPGIVHFDFGDGVRTGVGTADEDEADLSLVTVDMEKFRGFASGYLEVTREVLSDIEVKYLGLSGAYMAYIMGVRFLTDYLNGDVYYKVAGPEHNLLRARNQLRLTKEFMGRLSEMDAIVAGV
jgi:hypothetical protein